MLAVWAETRSDAGPQSNQAAQTATPPHIAALRDLRHRYNVAYTAYQSCVIALNEAALSGKKPAPELQEAEAKSLRELTEARRVQLAAMVLPGRADEQTRSTDPIPG